MRQGILIASTLAILVVACSASGGIDRQPVDTYASEIESVRSKLSSPEKLPPAMRSGQILRKSYYDCAQSTDGATWAIQDCIEAEFIYQDTKLNSAYRWLMDHLPRDKRPGLEAAQEKWVADQDKKCKWDAATEGQAQRLEANQCSLENTAKRANELDSMTKLAQLAK